MSGSRLIPIVHSGGSERALAAAGAYVYSDPVAISGMRAASIVVAYDPEAVGGYPELVPLVAFSEDLPAATDDAWFAMPATDGIPSAATLTGALPAGADWTLAPAVGQVDVRPLAVRPCAAALAASNEVRQVVAIDLASVPGARWLVIAIAEVGAVATPGSALVSVAVA